jgi:hypothetical protein
MKFLVSTFIFFKSQGNFCIQYSTVQYDAEQQRLKMNLKKMVYSLLNIATTFSNMFTIQLGKQIWQSSFQYYTDEIPKNNDIYHASKPRQLFAH